ncbi:MULTISPECIES: winged helix-turn-helix domain-containing protein [unclassified Microbulbifer]|uniref:winged helix-turn-helix domain-containing protein n=1 Tax=unclassified Microbulbifer TaxID=2619833 RepID=UPI0027E4DF9B|nr:MULTISPECIES: winged helix-turn-helix domain-containing protein [unclassified Microbulbifer]
MKGNNPGIDFYIGSFGISADRCILVGSHNEETKLTPKNMGVLIYLAENADRVISSDELLNKFWSPVASDHAVHKAIADLRSALGDNVRRQTYIKTLPRRGYKLLHAPSPISPASASEDNGKHLATMGKRVIEFGDYFAVGLSAALVLAVFGWLMREPASKKNTDVITVGIERFTHEGNVSSVDRVLNDGLTSNLADRLSKSKRLKIISISGSRREQPPPGTDHLVRGNLLQDDDRLRVLVHLVRSSDGLFEYSEKFDFEISEQSLFAIQDYIASSAAFNIATALDIEQDDNGKVPEYSLNAANSATYEQFAKGDSKAAGQ